MGGKTQQTDGDERQPLLQVLPPMPTVLSTDERDESEIVCENHTRNRRVMMRRSFVLLLIVGVLSLVTACTVRIYSNMNATINSAAEMTVKDVQYDGIDADNRAIKLVLDVDTHLNYTNTDFGVVTKNYLIWNSYLVNNLNIDLDNINITLNSGEKSLDSIGTVQVEPFNLKVYHGVNDHLQLRVKVKPDSTAVFKILKDIVVNKEVVKIDGDFMLKIKVGYLRVPIRSIRLAFSNVEIDPTALMDEVYAHHLKLESLQVSEHGIATSLSLKSARRDESLSRYINYIPSVPDSVYVDLHMQSCANAYFKMFDLQVSGLAELVKDLNANEVQVSTLNRIPDEFFDVCNGTGLSPLSALLQSVIYGDSETSFLVKSSALNRKAFPLWVNEEVLDNLEIFFRIPARGALSVRDKTTASIVQNVSISDLSLNIDSGFDRPQLQSGNVDFDLSIPWTSSGLEGFAVESLKGHVTLKYEGAEFGYSDIQDWLACEGRNMHTRCHLKENDIVITDGQVYGALLASYLMGGDILLGVDFTADALVDWRLVHDKSFEINGLRGSGEGTI